MSPPLLRIDGTRFRDTVGREVTIRGINCAADSKIPRHPNQPSHIKDNFFDGDNVSFVDRPFSREEARTHLARLKRWGYNTIRYIFTWEAIEHAGPGKYDEDYVALTIEILRMMKCYGFYVLMDPHQDVWSRFSGGSGAPLWTMYACGLNPEAFQATQAAFVHSQYPDPAKYPKMIWSTNYTRLACQTIFTLFFGGRDFAPNAIIDGKNIQDYLTNHYIAACRHLAQRIHDAGDLENEVVIGWESMNEPNRGLISWQDISVIPSEQKLQKGPSPTAWQAILTGAGRACEVDAFEFGSLGPYKSGRELIDPGGTMAWLPSNYDDTKYGWKRDPEWKLGQCLWAQQGVWDPTEDKLLKKDYFSKVPTSGKKLDYEQFTNTYFLDHYRKYRDAIRSVHKDAIMFCEAPVLEIPPGIKGTEDDDPLMVFASHYYDGLTLLTKHWNRLYNVDVFGLLRGKYWAPAFAVRLGETAIRNCLRDQLAAIKQEGLKYLGTHPCVFTEIGIPYDMDDKYAYRTGDYTSQSLAMDANHYALEGSGAAGYTLWTYVAQNNHEWGDLWNGEDLSIYSMDDSPLPIASKPWNTSSNPSSTSVDKTSPAYSYSQSESSLSVTPANMKVALKSPTISSEQTKTSGELSTKLGFRAAEAYVRPSPIATNGELQKHGFDLKSCTFTMSLEASKPVGEDNPTVIYLPDYHFGQNITNIEVSGGKWTVDLEEFDGGTRQILRWWHGAGKQNITVKGIRRQQGMDLGSDAEAGYLEQLFSAKPPRQQHSGCLGDDGSQHRKRLEVSPLMMNGASFRMGKNGDTGHISTISDITYALQVIHNSRSDNETRQKASEYLDSQKRLSQAAQNGYNLAGNEHQPPAVRHFGLSLLEHSVRHDWHTFDDAQVLDIRNWTISLSQSISEHEPVYLRNKVAHLLVEVAKKDWAISWFDMDSFLLVLWNRESRHKELALTVLESLSEDVFIREDSAAGIRGQDLHNAVVEIFTPASAFAGGQIKAGKYLRADEEGWLGRISQFLAKASQRGPNERDAKASICKALATLRSAFTWIMGPAIITTHCLESIFACLVSSDTDVLLAAIEALHSLYGRARFDEPEFLALVSPMCQEDNVALLCRLYEWSMVDCHHADTARYSFSKKFSETIAFIAGHIEERSASKLAGIDLSHFFRFMVGVIQHQSLIVSIPVLHAWVKILKSQHAGNLEAVWSVIGPLLDTASQRIIRYELLPEDLYEPSIVFLNEDIDTIPELHAFLGNYRRFCFQIIEIVALRKPKEAISHILPQVDASLDQIAAEAPQINPATYTKSSGSLLRLDAHLTVVEAALKGYSKWVMSYGKQPRKDVRGRDFLDSTIESWASTLLTRRNYEDPLMKQRIIKLAVECSARALERNQAFALKVLEHILLTQTADQPQYPAYSEAVRELQVYATSELRRLASRHADYFASFYDQLEAKIREVLATSSFDEKAEAEMYGTLLIVLQRATNMDSRTRDGRLQTLIESLLQGWHSGRLDQSLSSFENFGKHLGIDRVGSYLQSKQASDVVDWSTVQLDAPGLAIQSDMDDFVCQVPLRMTKTALGVMTEKLTKESQPYQIAVSIWSSRIPMLLPKVLRLVEYAHRLHDVESWLNLPAEMRSIISRVLQDRFWQAGISTGSRDEFYSQVTNSKSSLEGFASFVRGKIRLIREACYQILHSMSKLGEHFYSYSELPGPLAESLIASATYLSSHQFSVLLQMIRSMVDDCPITHRQHFLPPILSNLFRQIDHKITSEWEKIDRRKAESTEEENLTMEMKEESILRQLTYTAVTFVALLLDPFREQNKQLPDSLEQNQHHSPRPSYQHPPITLRTFILGSPTILEPLLLFSTNVLTIRDSRSTSTITKVLRTIVPTFAALSFPDTPTTAAIREYISTSILKAAITSLNDGYFADLQKELASLIASIWVAYGCITHFSAVHAPQNPDGTETPGSGQVVARPAYDRPPLSQTPKNIILSLPGMSAQRVESVAAALTATGGVEGHLRQQRALVLDLLDGLRGVRISELGKIDHDRASERSKLQERYMRVQERQGEEHGQNQRQDQEGMEGVEGKMGVGVDVDDGPDLGGVGELLG